MTGTISVAFAVADDTRFVIAEHHRRLSRRSGDALAAACNSDTPASSPKPTLTTPRGDPTVADSLHTPANIATYGGRVRADLTTHRPPLKFIPKLSSVINISRC